MLTVTEVCALTPLVHAWMLWLPAVPGEAEPAFLRALSRQLVLTQSVEGITT
jgi:hypothetical protein